MNVESSESRSLSGVFSHFFWVLSNNRSFHDNATHSFGTFTHDDIDLHVRERKQTTVLCVLHLHNTWISSQSKKHEVSMMKVLPQHVLNLAFYQLCCTKAVHNRSLNVALIWVLTVFLSNEINFKLFILLVFLWLCTKVKQHKLILLTMTKSKQDKKQYPLIDC